MDTFLGLTATGWTAIYTFITAGLLLGAIVAAIYAKRQWQASVQQARDQREAADRQLETSIRHAAEQRAAEKRQWETSIQHAEEQREADRESNRPYVIVTVGPSLATPQLFDLLVTNVGRRPAERVSIKLDPEPRRADETAGFEIARAKLLNEPVAMIAPDQELRVFFDSHLDRKGRDDLPKEHTVALSYSDLSGNRYESISTLDLDAMRGATYVGVKTVHDAIKSLGEIEKTLKTASVLARDGSLEVDARVESRPVALQRAAAEQAEWRRKSDEMREKLLPKQNPSEPGAADK